jgi:hypothetical protein
MLACPPDHRRRAFRTVRPAASNRVGRNRRAIEFCCPPGPLHLVFRNSTNTTYIGLRSLASVRNRLSARFSLTISDGQRGAPRGSGFAGPSRRAPASPSPPMDPQHGHSLDLAGLSGRQAAEARGLVECPCPSTRLSVRWCGRAVNSLSQPRRIQ